MIAGAEPLLQCSNARAILSHFLPEPRQIRLICRKTPGGA